MKKYEKNKNTLCADFQFVLGIPTNALNPQVKFYYKAKLRIIIGNARFSILTVAMATFACLKTALDQYWYIIWLFITKSLADLR